jgi:uncharacterized membrane protein
MGLLSLIALVVLFILVFKQSNRIARLEHIIKGSPEHSLPHTDQAVAPAQVPGQVMSNPLAQGAVMPPPMMKPRPLAKPLGPSAGDAFVQWLKDDWLLKLGALLLLISVGWFTTYAFMNNWIGPVGRITLGVVAGAAVLAFGYFWMRKHVRQGSVFVVLGSTIIILTIFAARFVYDFFTPLTALGVMFLSTVFVGVASVKYRVRSLALSGLILAALAPLLINDPGTDNIDLFAYLFVVTIGVIWVVALTGWRVLTTAALVMVALYSFPHLISYTTDDLGTVLVFMYLFAMTFFINNILGILRNRDGYNGADLVTAAGNGLLLLVWIMRVVPEQWQSMVIVIWMLAFAIGSFLILRVTGRREPFYIYAGVSVAMLAAATAAELSGAALTIAYTIEAAVIVLLSYVFSRDIRIAEKMSLLLIGPAVMSLTSIVGTTYRCVGYETFGCSSYAQPAIVDKDFFVIFILGAVLLLLGVFLWNAKHPTNEKSVVPPALVVVGSIYFFILIWRTTHLALEHDIATMISLLIYTVIGLATYFYGRMNDQRDVRMYGAALLGFVVLRLLIVDVWRMELSGRIITFFLIGILLMSTAFVGRKKHGSAMVPPATPPPNLPQ